MFLNLFMASDLLCRLVQVIYNWCFCFGRFPCCEYWGKGHSKGIVTALLPLAAGLFCSPSRVQGSKRKEKQSRATMREKNQEKLWCFPTTETQAEIKCYELEKTEGEKGDSTEEKQNAFIMALQPASSHRAHKAPYSALTAGRKKCYISKEWVSLCFIDCFQHVMWILTVVVLCDTHIMLCLFPI